ncbi:hypothetical protein SEA_PICKLES13_55 [Microbacterium phage Pickles13]|nr:hypothetical protein SEA_PICKLES13_55 [Microbacterium phage Pickles13]
MSTISQSTRTTRKFTDTVAAQRLEPMPRRVGFTATGIEVTQSVIDGKADSPSVALIGTPTKKDGSRAAYRGDKRLTVYGFATWDLRNGYTPEAIEIAEALADSALAEFNRIDWAAQS